MRFKSTNDQSTFDSFSIITLHRALLIASRPSWSLANKGIMEILAQSYGGHAGFYYMVLVKYYQNFRSTHLLYQTLKRAPRNGYV